MTWRYPLNNNESSREGWGEGGQSGGAMVLGKLQCRGVLLIRIIVEQGSIALAVGAVGSCLDILFSRFFLFSFSLFGR